MAITSVLTQNFIDQMTYRHAMQRVARLERYIHDNMHRNVPMERCELCRHLREDGEQS